MLVKNSQIAPIVITMLLVAAGHVSAEKSYSPYADKKFPAQVFWGDTHLHTNLSLDANLMGNSTVSPEQAYRFARGDSLVADNGMLVRLRRPLDFLVIADHAEELGVLDGLRHADPYLIETKQGTRLLSLYRENTNILDSHRLGDVYGLEDFNALLEQTNAPFLKTVWQKVIATADLYNNPGRFTAFSGYEWTSLDYAPSTIPGNLPTFSNLHRVVIFRDEADITSKTIPFSANDSKDPEKLWEYFEKYERETGGAVLAIPHNSNLSYGKMFSLKNYDGKSLNQSYSETRQRWEPLIEVTQIKGDSESHPLLSPTDSFANYEKWNSWYGRSLKGTEEAGSIELKKHEYARSSLKIGLSLKSSLKVNPFKFGLIGSTDSHTGLATAEEDNYFGKFAADAPNAGRMDKPMLPSLFPELRNWESSASGYAAVGA